MKLNNNWISTSQIFQAGIFCLSNTLYILEKVNYTLYLQWLLDNYKDRVWFVRWDEKEQKYIKCWLNSIDDKSFKCIYTYEDKTWETDVFEVMNGMNKKVWNFYKNEFKRWLED